MKHPVPLLARAPNPAAAANRNGMFHYVRMADAPQHCQNPFVIKTDSKIMVIIPTFETFLLETRHSLGLDRI